MYEDAERCIRAVQSKDERFDGWFFTAVLTTGIYCRPSCPAVPPKPQNMRFFPSAAAAQQAGFRACKRCRPDASPGSPEWNQRADLVARAMRFIADGVVDREGVAGPGRTARLQRPADRAATACRTRGRPAGAGSRAAGADRAAADRNHRPADGRRRVRGRAFPASGPSTTPSCRSSRCRRRRCAGVPAATGPRAWRSIPWRARRSGCAGRRRVAGRALAPAAVPVADVS